MKRYRAVVAYDGTNFLGYQVQATGRTVQGEIEKALAKISRTELRIQAAGRTDAGVHAIGQVIAFDMNWRHSVDELQRALNANLPSDVILTELAVSHSDFHPRFDAISRSYHYKIMNSEWPAVLDRHYAWHIRSDLDIASMQEASQILIGVHDFAAFGKAPQGNNTVRQIMQAEWYRQDKFDIFQITANAFLYRMVRRIVGTLVELGLGKLTQQDLRRILESCNLTQSAVPAPAHGLSLVQVSYPE